VIKTIWKDLRWLAAYAVIMIVMIPFALLPSKLSAALGEKLGVLLYYLLGKWRRCGEQTIAALLPHFQAQGSWNSSAAFIREVFVNLGALLPELSRLYFGTGQPLLDSVEFRGMENYDAAQREGRGIIAVTAHCGNWELMALALGLRTKPIAVVARHAKKAYFSKMLEKIRTRYGNKVIYRDHGVKDMLLFLKGNGLIGILPDQVVRPPHGILVDFFGRPCWTSAMPIKLALKTGSSVLPVFIHRENGRNIITFHSALELLATGSNEERILDGTIKMNLAIENHIRKYPTQWNWLYRRWKGVPDQPDCQPLPLGVPLTSA
jgi:KDO2-lipid IV(A) lauroyltransferase